MNTRIITAAALLAAALTPSLASAEIRGGTSQNQQAAVDACLAFNDDGALELDKVTSDGMGDYLVWFADADDNLTACNASAKGDVYAFVTESADLLDGDGPAMIHLVGTGGSNPIKSTEKLCLAVEEDDATVAATIKDGMGGYLVWLTLDAGGYVMCNASPDGKLFAFEDVDLPLNGADAGSTAETPAIQHPVPAPTGGHGHGNNQFGS
jgi:hypothetical protein